MNSDLLSDEQIGAFVRSWRKAHRLKQGELAELLGVHQTAVSHIEHGTRKLSAAELLVIQRAEANAQPAPFRLGGNAR